MPAAKLTGVPGGYEVWSVKQKDGSRQLFLAYYLPASLPGKRVPLLWRVPNREWARMSGGKKKRGKVDRYINHKTLRRVGAVKAGVSHELKDLGKHPFSGAIQDYKSAAKLRPWMRRREMVELWAESFLEGREVRDSDLKQTKWWRNNTEAERAWFELVKTDPATAKRTIEDNRFKVLKAAEQAGMANAPAAFINFYADRYTHGKISDVHLQKELERQMDPYSANGVRLAGLTRSHLPEGFRVVKHGGKMYVRTPKGDYELRGKASRNRFGGPKKAWKVNKVNVVGANKELAQWLNKNGHGVVIQGEDEVRQMVEDYIGPKNAEGKPKSFYGKWASLIRRDSSARDELIKELENTAAALFSNYSPGTKYSDVAPIYKQMFQEMWGETVDETDTFFWNQLRENDIQASMAQLRREGIRRGNRIQQGDLQRNVLAASNGGVRQAI